MVSCAEKNSLPNEVSSCDRAKEAKAFYETKAGIKELVDSGLTKIPKFLINPPYDDHNEQKPSSSGEDNVINLEVPIIDLAGFEICQRRRVEIVESIRKASEEWGFFQIVNHGIPVSTLNEMLASVKRFHELPQEAKLEFFSHEPKRVMYFGGNFMTHKAPTWRDTIVFDFRDGKLESELFPQVMREQVTQYMEHMKNICKILSELLSEALGLQSDYLSSIECMETESMVCHYYPPCPEPDLAIGFNNHADPCFLTILLQGKVDGLQVLHLNQWVDVSPLQGALTVNIGDLMQLITNDRFISAMHRVLARQVGPRTSAACFFYPSATLKFKPYGPIKELLRDNPPKYRETDITEYLSHVLSKERGSTRPLSYFKLA